jgi:hypothetical protein
MEVSNRIEPTTYRLLLCTNREVVSKSSFENADNSGFSTVFDWFLKVYNVAKRASKASLTSEVALKVPIAQVPQAVVDFAS